MGGQIKAVERLAPGGLEHQRGPPRSRTSSKSGLADAPSSSSLSPYSFVCETIEADRRRIIRGGKQGQTACRPRSAPSRYLLWKRRSPSSDPFQTYPPSRRPTQ